MLFLWVAGDQIGQSLRGKHDIQPTGSEQVSSQSGAPKRKFKVQPRADYDELQLSN